jgi:P27 family predicted phage terminase small subunit
MNRGAERREVAETQQVPRAPKGLTAAARREWTRVTNLLKERNALDALDEVALRDYVICWARLQECEADIDKRGVLVPGDRGLVKNPSVQISRQYREFVLAWTKQLGLSIAARTRLDMPQPSTKKVNPFAHLGEE